MSDAEDAGALATLAFGSASAVGLLGVGYFALRGEGFEAYVS